MRWKILGVNRVAVQLLGEAQRQLCQIAGALKTVRAPAVMPFPEALKFQLRTQQFKMQIVGSPLEFLHSLCLSFCPSSSESNHRHKRFTIIGQLNV
jgi:hypothetical protein